ncbi:MAG TPA: hypothetical protein VM937_03460, partial [Burkholderiaceae bacterium]|nr:hypothetical protein [Burkholderiaceae bacterium]
SVSPDFTTYDPSLGVDGVELGVELRAAGVVRVEAAGAPDGVAAKPGLDVAGADGRAAGGVTEGAVATGGTVGETTGASARSDGGSSSTVYSRITRPVAHVNSTIKSRYGSFTGPAELMRTT